MAKNTSKLWYGISGFFIGAAWFVTPDYKSAYLASAFVVTAAAFFSPVIINYLSHEGTYKHIRIKNKKTRQNLKGLIGLIWLVIVVILLALAYEEYRIKKISIVHVEKVEVYIVETNFGEYSFGVTAKILNQWHKGLVIEKLKLKGSLGYELALHKFRGLGAKSLRCKQGMFH